MELTQTIMDAATIVAVVVGISQIIKEFGVPSKYIPAIAVLLGIGVPIIPAGIVQGIIYGLTATGLFRAGKQITTGANPSPTDAPTATDSP